MITALDTNVLVACPEGQHFLMVQQPREAIQTRIEVVLNWFTVLKQAVGDKR